MDDNLYLLKQEIECLRANLDGRKTYWYVEEVQRDQRRYDELTNKLKQIERDENDN